MARQKKAEKFPLLAYMEQTNQMTSTARDTIKAMLSYRRAGVEEAWRGLIALPPGTLIESIVSEFYVGTNIPLEIPYMVTLHWVAAWLLKNDITLAIDGVERAVRPDIWTVILAPSGAGKSFTEGQIRDGLAMPDDMEFPGTGLASAAAFTEALSEHNRGIWIRDEFAQLLKQMSRSGGPLEDLKDLLLRIYDNRDIVRKTREYEIRVEDPALVILGLTVDETFARNVSTEDMLDGFAQRFGYILAKRDPHRPMKDYPLYKVHTKDWRAEFERLTKSVIHKQYLVGPEAVAGYKTAFSLLLPRSEMPESFYRRILWRAHKYALAYHVLVGKGESQDLDAADYGWAARALHLHIQDAMTLLNSHGLGELENLCRRVEELRDEAEAKGKTLTSREVIRRVNAIKNVRQAQDIMRLVGVSVE